jgi:hypothetical protein
MLRPQLWLVAPLTTFLQLTATWSFITELVSSMIFFLETDFAALDPQPFSSEAPM